MRTLSQFAQDIRYAARQLRRSPRIPGSILLVPGLGIGANASIFSILNVTRRRMVRLATAYRSTFSLAYVLATQQRLLHPPR